MRKINFLSILRESRTSRIICAFLAVNFIAEVTSPTLALALTSGAVQPEFASFEPIATTDMVNDFTGDFTYNLPILEIPGPDGGGYAMSLSYHSGSSSEDEASWVGFGWTLNPGAINRGRRGYPDEFSGNIVKNYNKQKPNYTTSANFDFRVEYEGTDGKPKTEGASGKLLDKVKSFLKNVKFDMDKAGNEAKEPADVSVSISHRISYNNYSGFSIANNFGLGVKGMATLSMNRQGGQSTFGFSVNPFAVLRSLGVKLKDQTAQTAQNTDGTSKLKKMGDFSKKQLKKNLKKLYTSSYSAHSYNAPAHGYSVAKYTGASWNFSSSVQLNLSGALNFGFQMGFGGNMTVNALEGESIQNAYGYLYSNKSNIKNAHDKENSLFDYQIEKESTFNKHDKNLGIPFNNADMFSVTGNDVSGGFRFYHDSIGCYFPNTSESVMKIRQIGVEIGIGMPLSVGLDFGVGKQKTVVNDLWPNMSASKFDGRKFSPPEDAIMRFANDPGGELTYRKGAYDELLTATITKKKQLVLDTMFMLGLDPLKKSSSSDIRYIQDPATKLIEGIEITSKNGTLNSYLQPVYTKNETNLTVPIQKNQDGSYLVTKKVYVDDPMKNKNVSGQVIADKYASTYLLTSKTNYNYVDADTIAGPSEGDFGGWTKFDYRMAHGGSGNWYHFRTPYQGLLYNSGRMNDLKDQTGSFSSGDKEIYYLKCIESKSHIAFFVTDASDTTNFTVDFPIAKYPFLYDSNNLPLHSVLKRLQKSSFSRQDGLDAAGKSLSTGEDLAANSMSAKGSNSVEKLECIVLFAKAELSTPLSTTFFRYDQSLCKGIPNFNGPPVNGQNGKLTLRKVWTESYGVTQSRIAPYQFHYQYFSKYNSKIISKYPWAQEYNNYINNGINENPNYAPEQLDPWGFYQANGKERFEKQKTWVNQLPDATFDPAAWQLKRIQLPSGGEIHIQYEQEDYFRVQDQKPMAMVSLLPDDLQNGYLSKEKGNEEGSVYCINTSDIGVTNIAAYTDTLKRYFINENNKLYFKVLYSYTEDDQPQINVKNNRYEYITGYTQVNNVTSHSGKIFLHLGELKGPKDKGKKDKTLPRYVCYQELLSSSGTNLGNNAKAYSSDDLTLEVYQNNPIAENDIDVAARQRVIENTRNIFEDWVSGNVKNVKRKDACKSLNLGLSYFKLPVEKSKKGGGIRVKRLLSYDPGISAESGGDAMVYGNEYIYEMPNGISSGVALNEPPGMREENALVKYVNRFPQGSINKLLNGRDTKTFEGPLGESVLPSAQVDYQRVIIKNIHSGTTSSGYQVNTYHSASEFPFLEEHTDLSLSPIFKSNSTYRKTNLNLPLGLINLDINKAWVAQGYIFKLNDMHGKLASKATYAGNYNRVLFNASSYSNIESYQYSKPGEKIKSLVFDRQTDEIKQQMLSPGTEEDFTVAGSSVHEKTSDFSVELDLLVAFGFPVQVRLSGIGITYVYQESLLCQHVTSKVVRQRSYLLSVTNVNDGITQVTQNLAFDKYTGDPVLTRTFDGYMTPGKAIYTENNGTNKHNGHYYSMNIPASWMYPSMGPKTDTIANTNQLTEMAGSIVTYGKSNLFDKLSSTGKWNVNTDTINNVVSANAIEYRNNWFSGQDVLDPALAGISTQNLNKINAFLYPYRSYSYRDNVLNANNTTTKVYKGGTVANPFVFFNWTGLAQNQNQSVSEQWYSNTKTTRYSPHGYPLEEQDTLNIKASALYGYNNTLPIVVAQNAGFGEIKFVDFEHGTNNDPNVTSMAAHSGKYSFDYSANNNHVFVQNFSINQDMITKNGLSVKFWMKSKIQQNMQLQNYGLSNPNQVLKVELFGPQTALFDCKKIAQTGEWALYSADIQNFKGLSAGIYSLRIKYPSKISNELVLIDDLRMQPLNASMNCSVYNPDNKLAVQFDDQHFGVYYEYDYSGRLIRKNIETEKGKKTVQEQQQNSAHLFSKDAVSDY